MENFHLELDAYGVLNLHKALLEAKFHPAPENELVAGSPLVAEIYIQVREYLVDMDGSGQWREWFQLKNRPDYRERAVCRMKKCRRWRKASPDEKADIAQAYLAPFLYEEGELCAVIAEVDDQDPREAL